MTDLPPKTTCPHCNGDGAVPDGGYTDAEGKWHKLYAHCPTCHGEGVLRCLDDGRAESPCAGEVALREPMSPTRIPYPRCEKHYEERLKEQRRIVRTYGGRMFYG